MPITWQAIADRNKFFTFKVYDVFKNNENIQEYNKRTSIMSTESEVSLVALFFKIMFVRYG